MANPNNLGQFGNREGTGERAREDGEDNTGSFDDESEVDQGLVNAEGGSDTETDEDEDEEHKANL